MKNLLLIMVMVGILLSTHGGNIYEKDDEEVTLIKEYKYPEDMYYRLYYSNRDTQPIEELYISPVYNSIEPIIDYQNIYNPEENIRYIQNPEMYIPDEDYKVPQYEQENKEIELYYRYNHSPEIETHYLEYRGYYRNGEIEYRYGHSPLIYQLENGQVIIINR